jgi:hypothetical protein
VKGDPLIGINSPFSFLNPTSIRTSQGSDYLNSMEYVPSSLSLIIKGTIEGSTGI